MTSSDELKEKAQEAIKALDGELLGFVQMGIDTNGHMSVCIGGLPDIITKMLATSMNKDKRVKEIFESAVCESMGEVPGLS